MASVSREAAHPDARGNFEERRLEPRCRSPVSPPLAAAPGCRNTAACGPPPVPQLKSSSVAILQRPLDVDTRDVASIVSNAQIAAIPDGAVMGWNDRPCVRVVRASLLKPTTRTISNRYFYALSIGIRCCWEAQIEPPSA